MDQNGGLDSDPQEWGMHPPGGFLNMFRNPTEQSPPQIVDNHGAKKVRKSASKSSRRSQPLINLDSGEDDGDGARTDRRLQYTKEEEVRLVSAWLNNSNDPINGNGKKTDLYWGDVTDEYNSTTPNNRRRTSKQLKDHFQKIKKKVSLFCSSWKEAVSVRNSGQSDEQVMDNAQKIYEEYKDGPFLLKHCWMILRDEPKWQVILEDNMVPNKRKFNEGGVMDEHVPVTVQSDDERVILHNMIVEDEKEMVKFPIDLNEHGGSSISLPPEVKMGGDHVFSEVLRRRAKIRNHETHTQLKKDLTEHIWQQSSNRNNN
ncbi:unnamed protein product [Urochloa humidicola]